MGCQNYQIPPDSKKVGHKSAVKNIENTKRNVSWAVLPLFSARLFRTNVISSYNFLLLKILGGVPWVFIVVRGLFLVASEWELLIAGASHIAVHRL